MSGKPCSKGFTLIELLVVMAIIATLLSIATPRYLRSVDDAREAALKANLAQLRLAIDLFHDDRGVYPPALSDLVDKHYLRAIPVDPMTDSAQTWQPVPVPDSETADAIYDVRSGAPGTSRLGDLYANW